MHGNVYEWVQDCYRNSYAGAPNDGSAWDSEKCTWRARRGGTWLNEPRHVRAANRSAAAPPSARSHNGEIFGGMRVARTTAEPMVHTFPLFRPAGQTQQGFARIINRSNRRGTVHIYGTDDSGRRRGPITLSLDARATRHFNSEDLEAGNAEKGLNGRLGNGQGDWRLELESDLDLEPSAYIRTGDGFLTAMHAVVRTAEVGADRVHQVSVFNPGSNRRQVSWLRVANLDDTSARVLIRGRDDAGRAAPLGEVRLTLPAHGARRLSAQALESGAAGLSGRLGEGEGKWQLSVTADAAIEVVSLLQSPTGHLSNLSTTPGDGNDAMAEAVDVAVGAAVSGRIDSVGDVDYFRIDVAHNGTLVVWTRGDVETELALLDASGNPLAAAAGASTSAVSGVVMAKAATLAPNLSSKEYKVLAGDRVIVKVGHKSGLGGFNLESKNVRAGVTNVNASNPVPSLNVSAGGSGVTVGLGAHFHNPNQVELTYSASIEQIRVGGLPINVGVSVSGSEMTIIAPESGPAWSGTITITVRVTDPLGLLFAELEFPMQFTREGQSEMPSGEAAHCVEFDYYLDDYADICSFDRTQG